MIPPSPVAILKGPTVLHHLATASSTSLSAAIPSDLIVPALNILSPVLFRGGFAEIFRGHDGGVLDIGRVNMRLEGFQVYATLSALLTNACLDLYSSVKTPTKEKEEAEGTPTKVNRLAADAFLVCVVISVLFGSYTTIVFGLFSILSKTALGRGLNTEFLDFWAQSASIRESGFESFLYALVSFEISFVLSLFLKIKGRRRVVLVTLACAILLASIRRWTSLLYLASKILFPLRMEVEY